MTTDVEQLASLEGRTSTWPQGWTWPSSVAIAAIELRIVASMVSQTRWLADLVLAAATGGFVIAVDRLGG